MSHIERTLVLIKPDGIQRELVGEVLSRFERKGLKIVGMKMLSLDETVLAEHYAHHVGKPFYDGLVKFMMETPVVGMVFEGINVVTEVRKILGSTNPREADAGTIRADLSMDLAGNIVHASDTTENAQIEIARFFKPEDLFTYTKLTDPYIFG